jgi:hypothetical protein
MPFRRLVPVLLMAIVAPTAPAIAQLRQRPPTTMQEFEQQVIAGNWAAANQQSDLDNEKRTWIGIDVEFGLEPLGALFLDAQRGARRHASSAAAQAPSAAPTGALSRVSPVFGFSVSRFGFGNGGGYLVTSYMGGVRYWLPAQAKFLPFLQGSIGIERSFEENAFAFAPGGGVLIPLNRFILSLKGGIRRAAYEFGGNTSTQISVGVLVPFGAR